MPSHCWASKGVLVSRGRVAHETRVVERPFDDVVSDVEKRAEECLDRDESHWSAVDPGGIVSRFIPSVARISERQAEFTLRWISGGVTMPQGGYFLMAADFTHESPDTTRMDMAYPTIGHTEIPVAFRAWVAGTSDECPSEL